MQVETMTDTDVANIKTATDELTQKFYKISEKLYQQNAQQAGAEGAQPNGGNDDVVDGSGKEI